MISLQKYADKSFSLSMKVVSKFSVDFPWGNICYDGFKSIGITVFMTVFFLGTID